VKRKKDEVTLDGDVRYRVEFDQDRSSTVAFVVQLEFGAGDNVRPVLRYDTAHGFAHCDRYRPDGSVSKHEPMAEGDFNQALTAAVKDVLDNWEDQVRPFRGRLRCACARRIIGG